MQTQTLKLAGTGVLATCALLIFREIGSRVPDDNRLPNTRVRSESNSSRISSMPRSASANADCDTPPYAGKTLAGFEHREAAYLPLSVTPITKPLPAVQLSASARLPVVIFAQFESGKSGLRTSTRETLAVTDSLVSSFYLDLAQRVAADSPDNLAADESGNPLPAGEATALIESGPLLDVVTARANEQFRALFGQNAYNVYSITSALEISASE